MIRLFPYHDLEVIQSEIVNSSTIVQQDIDAMRRWLDEHPYFFNGNLRIAKNFNTDHWSVDVQDNVDYATVQTYTKHELGYKLGVWGFVYLHDGTPVWGKRSDSVLHPGIIHWPVAGAVDSGESFYETLVREMREEIGITENDVTKIIPIAVYQIGLAEVGCVYSIILKKEAFLHITAETSVYFVGGIPSDHGPVHPDTEAVIKQLENI